VLSGLKFLQENNKKFLLLRVNALKYARRFCGMVP
jgi:hypothetical protein